MGLRDADQRTGDEPDPVWISAAYGSFEAERAWVVNKKAVHRLYPHAVNVSYYLSGWKSNK